MKHLQDVRNDLRTERDKLYAEMLYNSNAAMARRYFMLDGMITVIQDRFDKIIRKAKKRKKNK